MNSARSTISLCVRPSTQRLLISSGRCVAIFDLRFLCHVVVAGCPTLSNGLGESVFTTLQRQRFAGRMYDQHDVADEQVQSRSLSCCAECSSRLTLCSRHIHLRERGVAIAVRWTSLVSSWNYSRTCVAPVPMYGPTLADTSGQVVAGDVLQWWPFLQVEHTISTATALC